MDKEALKKLTVAELKEQVKKIPGVKGVSSMKKDDLVDVLSKQGGDAKPAKEPTKTDSAPLGKSGIKLRIRELKEEKRKALSQHDHSKARECNRRIHRYKRKLRKMVKEKQ